MADKHDDQRKHEDKKDKKDKREKRKDKRDSPIREAFSALKHMPAMNPNNLAPIPDEFKGSTDKPKDSDKT